MLGFNEIHMKHMKCIQSILEMVKEGKLEMDCRLKYTWIWHVPNVWDTQRNLEVHSKV